MKLSPETRTALIEGFTFHAPLWLKRASSRRFGLPLRPEVRRAGVIFIHVPKNAGTTIATELYGRHIGHRSALFYRAADPEFFASTPSFGLTRAPLARFLSAFHFACAGGSTAVPASARVTAFARGFENPAACARAIATLSEDARAGLDPVFKRQSDYLCDANGQVMVSRLWRLEEVAGGVIEIAGRRISLTERHNRGGTEAAPADAETRAAVREAYARDYAAFGYAHD